FVEKVMRARAPKGREWLKEVLGKHVVLAALLAAEAGDALPRALQEQIAGDFGTWALRMPWPIVERPLGELALTDFGPLVGKPLLDAIGRIRSGDESVSYAPRILRWLRLLLPNETSTLVD